MSQPDIDAPSQTIDWSEQAPKLLKGNLRNLAQKVIAGQPLTQAEVNILKAEMGAEDGGSAGQPEYAKNQSQLAEILGISRKTIQRYVKKPKAPKPRPNGSLCVSEWRTFLAANDVLEPEGEDIAALKARQILLQNEKLEHQLSVLREEYISKIDAEKETAELIAQAKRVLLSGPSALAPQVVGVSIPEAETLLKQWLHDALAKLHSDPLGKEGDNVKPD
ncbi:MAG: hypothetical protein JWR19_2172 [Pedosphaera sp.]|nr:hypothetical protein [Pedosphaera sp.]